MTIPFFRRTALNPTGLIAWGSVKWEFSQPIAQAAVKPPGDIGSVKIPSVGLKSPDPPKDWGSRTIEISPGFINALNRLQFERNQIRPEAIFEQIEPAPIGESLTPEYFRRLYGLDTPEKEPSADEIELAQAQAAWASAQEAIALYQKLEREFSEKEATTLTSSGGGGGEPVFLGSAVRQPNPGWTPTVIDGGAGRSPTPSAPSNRYREIQDAWNRTPANKYPWDGRAPAQRPVTINQPPTAPVPRNAAAIPGSTNKPYLDSAWKSAADRIADMHRAAERAAAANRSGLANPGRLPLPGSLRPIPPPAALPPSSWIPELFRGAAEWARGAGRNLNRLGRVPLLWDMLFPEPLGDLTPEAVAAAKGIRPPSPSGQSPAGTPKPPTPGRRRTPEEVGSPWLERTWWYSVKTWFKHGSRTRTILTTNAAGTTDIKVEHIGWLVEGSAEVQLYGPLSMVYLRANPAVVANYINPPSEWQWVGIRHSEGIYYLTGTSGANFAITEFVISIDDGTGPEIIPPGDPFWVDPPPLPPTGDQPEIGTPPARRPRIGPGTGTNPEVVPVPGISPPIAPPPGLLPPPIPAFPPITPAPGQGNPLNPNSPAQPSYYPPPTPKAPPALRPPGLSPPALVPGPRPGVAPGRTPCTPKGEIEQPMPCRAAPDMDALTKEILRRLGDPGKNPNGLSGAIVTDRDSLKNTIGKPIEYLPGKITSVTDQLKKMRGTQLLMQAFSMLNMVVLLHNAAMLSRNLIESVGDMLSMSIQAIKKVATGGTTEDEPIDVNELVGQGFQGLMTDIFGKAAWTEIQAKWVNINRILTSAANVAYTIQGIFDGARNVIEITSTNVARIGNALRNSRIVNQGAFPWMNPNLNSATGRFEKLRQMVDNSTELADLGTSIAGEVVNISDESKELADNTTRFNEAVTEGQTLVNDAGQLVDKDGKIIRDSNKQQGALAESARRVSQGSEFSFLDMAQGERPSGGSGSEGG